MTDLVINPEAEASPYAQLKQQLIERILARRLPAGTKLPAVRRLAADLGLANNTVARAYRELEAEGYVETLGRGGTIVADIAPIDSEARRVAADLTREYVAAMRSLGLGPDATIGAVRQELQA